jgi:hypothetical protein
MTYTHLHRPYDDTVSAYVIADEALHRDASRAGLSRRKKKPRTSRTPHIRQDNRDDTDTHSVYKGHHTTSSACVARRCGCLVRMQYRALM